MILAFSLLLLVVSVVFGIWGWRRGTWSVEHLPGLHLDHPVGMTQAEWGVILARRYRLRRWLMTLGGALGAPAVAFAVIMFLAHRR